MFACHQVVYLKTQVAQQSVTNLSVTNINLVTPKVRAKHELLFCKLASEVYLWNILSVTQVSKQSVTNIISVTIVNLVTPKGRAKHEPLFYRPASEMGLLSI